MSFYFVREKCFWPAALGQKYQLGTNKPHIHHLRYHNTVSGVASTCTVLVCRHTLTSVKIYTYWHHILCMHSALPATLYVISHKPVVSLVETGEHSNNMNNSRYHLKDRRKREGQEEGELTQRGGKDWGRGVVIQICVQIPLLVANLLQNKLWTPGGMWADRERWGHNDITSLMMRS